MIAMAVKPMNVTLSKASPRYATWIEIFGTQTVRVLGAAPRLLNLRGVQKLAFLLDLDALTQEQRSRLVDHLSQEFDADKSEVRAALDRVGLPILEEDLTWAIDMRFLI